MDGGVFVPVTLTIYCWIGFYTEINGVPPPTVFLVYGERTIAKPMINQVLIERQNDEGFNPTDDITDVIVELEDGAVWSASFATISYLQRQMFLSHEVASDSPNMPPVRFVALETPHVIIENLNPDTIEDVIDNLMTLGTFESVFFPCEDEFFLETMKG